MRLREISAPSSHPYVASIAIDPVQMQRLERMIENARELRLLDVDDRTPDQWRVRIGCASAAVRDAVEDGWG